MHIKSIVAKLESGEELELEISRIFYRGSINDYAIADDTFKYFQYDTSDRPSDYKDEYKEEIWFRGYLIGRRVKGVSLIVECMIQVRY